jgi:hypothetical protein
MQPTGLNLIPNQHYIGATAGGIVNSAVVEIKCPSRAQNITVQELVAGPD